MKEYKDVCEILGVDRKTFDDVIANKSNYYYSYPIRKRNGKKRYIDAPIGILKEWQEIITKKVLYRYGAHPIAYGFAKDKNPIQAAEVHVGQDILVAMDMKNFFNSIKEAKLAEMFSYLHGQKKIWSNLTPGYKGRHEEQNLSKDLIAVLTLKGIVPQGAPSSPAVSNLFMLRADKLLSLVARQNGCKVSRYADDIVFSGSNQNMASIVIGATKNCLAQYGLMLNPKKIHINRKNRRMRVVGIVVNEKTNIPREKWRNFRAKLHNLKVSQTPIDELEAQKLRGQIEWIKSVNPSRGVQFLKEFGQLKFTTTSNTSTPIMI